MSTMTIAALDFEAQKMNDARIEAVMIQVRRKYRTVITHPSHVKGVIGDCYRCINCEVLWGGLQSGTPCSTMFDWATAGRLHSDPDGDPGYAVKQDVPFTGVPVVSIEPMSGGSGPADWFDSDVREALASIDAPHPHDCPVCVCGDCGVPFDFHKQTAYGDMIHGVVASTSPRSLDDYDDDAASDRSLRDEFGYSLQ